MMASHIMTIMTVPTDAHCTNPFQIFGGKARHEQLCGQCQRALR